MDVTQSFLDWLEIALANSEVFRCVCCDSGEGPVFLNEQAFDWLKI